jgi:twitching motility protein PilT
MHAAGASDLLLTAGAPPQLRMAGELRPCDDAVLTESDTAAVADEILDTRQRAVFRDKKSLDLATSIRDLCRFRVHVYRQRGTVAMAFRIIPRVVNTFEQLGLPPTTESLCSLRQGLVLVTGPAGSGKSTTLAAMVDRINATRGAHIVCIEDPIEYLHTHKRGIVEQREIPDDAPSFSDALRNVFRESPDVIMVGEMRDLETVHLALTLAETGHLILGTLHTHDTTHCISRIVDIFPPEQQCQVYTQLSLVLEGVIAQQLVPVEGGRRMALACEVMRPNHAIRNLIRGRQLQQIYSAIDAGREEGMVTMNEALRELVMLGFIDGDAAIKRSPYPREMAQRLNAAPSCN